MRNHMQLVFAVACVVAHTGLLAVFAATERLPTLNIDPNGVSVSGLSSGAFFATQMQVAHSSLIMGAGIVAGGPYDCARSQSYMQCMYQSTPAISKPISNTKSWSGVKIDDISNLARQRVFMFSGTQDSVVAKPVMDQLYKYYVTEGKFLKPENVLYESTKRTGHTFPTDFASPGNSPCTSDSSPYISDCGYDGAGNILQFIYGTLKPRNNGALTGTFVQFDQSEYLANPTSSGLDKTGWAYVPAGCAAGQLCKLHVALHGCQQSYSAIGDKFVKNTGYTKWADSNNIVLVFPQSVPTNTIGGGMVTFPNSNGCYDWVGWYGEDYDQINGKQVTAVRKMIARVMGGASPPVTSVHTTVAPSGQCFTGSNWDHVLANRAYQRLGLVYANGSDDYMGLYNVFVFTKLRQTGANYYVVDEKC